MHAPMLFDKRGGPAAVGDLESIRQRMVTVSCGTKQVTDTYVGKTVSRIREELASELQIPSGAKAVLNGTVVPKDQEGATLFPSGSQLEFIQRTGTKG